MNMCESDWFWGHSILMFTIFYHIWYDDTLWHMDWLFGWLKGFQSDSSIFGLPLVNFKYGPDYDS